MGKMSDMAQIIEELRTAADTVAEAAGWLSQQLGGTLLLGMLDNALTLNGVDVNLVSATKGALIFLAILLDHLRYRLTAWIMHRENIRRLMRSVEVEKDSGDTRAEGAQ